MKHIHSTMVRGTRMCRLRIAAQLVDIQPITNGYEITLEWAFHPGHARGTFKMVQGKNKPHACGLDMGRLGLPGLICPRAFDTESELKSHHKSVHQLNPFCCEWCSRLIMDGSNYDKHVKCCSRRPDDLPAQVYPCRNLCGYASPRSDNTRRHMLTCAGPLAAAPAAPAAAVAPVVAPAAAAANAVATPPLAAVAAPVGALEHHQPAYVPAGWPHAAATNDLPSSVLAGIPEAGPYEQPYAFQMEGNYPSVQNWTPVSMAADVGVNPTPSLGPSFAPIRGPYTAPLGGEPLPALDGPQVGMASEFEADYLPPIDPSLEGFAP